jgi:hypothetical protein
MTLQKLLLKLSKNKAVSVDCFCADDIMTITLKTWYDFDTIIRVDIDLSKKIEQEVIDKLKPYFA